MSVLRLELRADVLDAVTHGLRGSEGLADVIEDVAYWEAAARKRYRGSGIDESTPIDCAMNGPLEQISVDVPEAPVRMLHDLCGQGRRSRGLSPHSSSPRYGTGAPTCTGRYSVRTSRSCLTTPPPSSASCAITARPSQRP